MSTRSTRGIGQVPNKHTRHHAAGKCRLAACDERVSHLCSKMRGVGLQECGDEDGGVGEEDAGESGGSQETECLYVAECVGSGRHFRDGGKRECAVYDCVYKVFENVSLAIDLTNARERFLRSRDLRRAKSLVTFCSIIEKHADTVVYRKVLKFSRCPNSTITNSAKHRCIKP